MDTERALLKKIMQYDFTLKELDLYLDTHPSCSRGLAMFAKFKKLREAAAAEYNDKFGPLVPEQSKNLRSWDWVSDPWPWERS
ncbi:MAG: spore coat protein CotJB [Ruminococcus sp.]|nr:spore coat protein CotJB [Ruminococcus sp.]